MNILEEVKQRLEIEDDSQDVIINGYIKDISDKIKSICNRTNIPEELNYLIIRYAMNCAVFYKNGYGEGKQVVSSLSDVNQSVSFKDVGAITSDDVNMDKYLSRNKDEISMYAYMRW